MTPRISALVFALAATSMLACGASFSATTSPNHARRGTLQIVGGGPQPPELVQHFVELAGGRGRARIVVFAMASALGHRSGESKANDFRELGAEARNVWITREQANTDSVVALMNGVT